MAATEAKWTNRIRINVIKISSPIISKSLGSWAARSLLVRILLFNKNDRSMKWMNNYLQSPLRGVLYRKPCWWMIPKVCNLMCLLNTMLTTQQWHRALLQGKDLERREKAEAAGPTVSFSWRQAISLPKFTMRKKAAMRLTFEVPLTCSHAETSSVSLIRPVFRGWVGITSQLSFFWSEHPCFPEGPPCPLPSWGWGSCGLTIKAPFPWKTPVEGRDQGP